MGQLQRQQQVRLQLRRELTTGQRVLHPSAAAAATAAAASSAECPPLDVALLRELGSRSWPGVAHSAGQLGVALLAGGPTSPAAFSG